jgi:hypothetical protein
MWMTPWETPIPFSNKGANDFKFKHDCAFFLKCKNICSYERTPNSHMFLVCVIKHQDALVSPDLGSWIWGIFFKYIFYINIYIINLYFMYKIYFFKIDLKEKLFFSLYKNYFSVRHRWFMPIAT